ncbi:MULTISPECIES: exodeoxyribonuclease VII large subunit [Oceanotoga]|uniref:exodeoxyribonuclease VII large subunit n=1 Tax=Oceanotoga TaxID=1255275 RepID=UPI00272E80FE|nr:MULTISPECIES: exodeoxyribonuclease VII large subunit [Oceanotoga]
MLFQENKDMQFENIQQLINYINNIIKNTSILDLNIEVISDITTSKVSKRGDLYIELSQKVGYSNYSITVFFPEKFVPYILKNLNLKHYSELSGKKWVIKGKLNFWKMSSKFVLHGSSIESAGESEIEKNKLKILKKLEMKSLINKNTNDLKTLDPIKKIAIISSPTAAGYGDFIKNINHAELIPITHLYPSAMQGAGTVPGIIGSFYKILETKIKYDIVVIIRGGGSKSDLMYFDDEELAYYIAKFNLKIPVLTGIGHEQDKSIPDYVSWKSYSTPTEVSRDIVNQINENIKRLKTASLNSKIYFNSSFKDQKNNLNIQNINFFSTRINQKLDQINEYIKKFYKYQYNVIDNKIMINKSYFIKNKNIFIKNYLNSILIEINKTLNNKIIDIKNGSFLSINQKKDFLNTIYLNITKNSPFSVFLSDGALIKKENQIINSAKKLKENDSIEIIFKDGNVSANIYKINNWEEKNG